MLTEQFNSEFYSICVNRDLAGEIRKAMAQIISFSPALTELFEVSKSTLGRIKCIPTKSWFEPRVSQSGKNNAIRPAAKHVGWLIRNN